jgi:rare lipoprotein A
MDRATMKQQATLRRRVPRDAGARSPGSAMPAWALVSLLLTSLLVSGCARQQTLAYQPPPPAVSYGGDSVVRAAVAKPAAPPVDLRDEAREAPHGFFDDTRGKPVFTEVGLATWYGPHYEGRMADGTVLNANAMTAAHRTLPLGSTVRVTNLATGQQVLVRITDRGPFVPGRVLDLSLSAARAVGVYRAGTAKVKLEAFAHASADPAGRWCVQTGAFKAQDDALDLKAALVQRYRGAKVSEFQGPTGFWVRIDPAQHGKGEALEIADWIGQPDPAAFPFLVRID